MHRQQASYLSSYNRRALNRGALCAGFRLHRYIVTIVSSELEQKGACAYGLTAVAVIRSLYSLSGRLIGGSFHAAIYIPDAGLFKGLFSESQIQQRP